MKANEIFPMGKGDADAETTLQDFEEWSAAMWANVLNIFNEQ